MKILSEWEDIGYLVRFPYIMLSRDFWQFTSDVLFDFYVSEITVDGGERE